MAKKKFVNYIVTEPRLAIPAAQKKGTLKALTAIRELFGPRGQYWITGAMKETLRPGAEDRFGSKVHERINTFCLVGGVREVDGKYEDAARAAIALAVHQLTNRDVEEIAYRVSTKDDQEETIIDFNDDRAEWKDVVQVLKRARKLIEQA